jgi:hypothetical protein
MTLGILAMTLRIPAMTLGNPGHDVEVISAMMSRGQQ